MKLDTHAPGRTVEQIAEEFFVPAGNRGEGSTQGADGDSGNFSFQLSPLSRAIVEISRNDRSTVKNLADVIVDEPLFSARLLKLAKFSSGLSLQPSTVAQAISTFGMDHLKSLALGLSLFGMESSPPKEEAWQPAPAPVTLRQLWEHSLGCAAMAGLIAAKIGHPAPHLVFVAGFLHDLGRLLFYRRWKERFLETVSLAIEKSIPSVEAETLGMGINHPEFGAHWATHAELPFWLQQTIRYHHVPFYTLTDVVDAKTAKIIALVQLADSECENLAISRGGDLGECSGDLWTKLNLRVEDWTEHLQIIKREIEASRAVFGFDADGFGEPDDRRRAALKTRAEFHDPNGSVNTQRRGQIMDHTQKHW
ncbi:MAG: HDOD domain-containing protein [Deltaproteobacteria bacterium]|nr:HDOD domain-containing protein [Deltaproteobacteria bacterium]MDZ4346543.1 HDOD domain-containing protein [Candidatus Binatia bacterium]